MLTIALAAFWMTLSGYTKPLLLGFGVATVIGTVIVARLMRTTDEEGIPLEFVLPMIGYLPWLLLEIMKSSWAVTKIIVDPRLPISPTMTAITPLQATPVGVNIFANSITLTPGTVTTGARLDELIVHALVRENADDLEAGGMNGKVAHLEGRKPEPAVGEA